PRGSAAVADVSGTVADNATIVLVSDGPTLRRMAVKAGRRDNVHSVAKRYQVRAEQVAEWNSVGTGAKFSPGQTVIVYILQKGRGSSHAAAPTRTARGHRSTTARVAAKAAPKARGKRAAAKPSGKHVHIAEN
ncbi:MAG: LysM domain-containing protein, partial [Caldimonas sp.]